VTTSKTSKTSKPRAKSVEAPAEVEAVEAVEAPDEEAQAVPASAPIEAPAPVEEPAARPGIALLDPGALGSALITEQSRLVNAVTGGDLDPEDLFEKVTEVGTALRSRYRIAESKPMGEGYAPMVRLVLAHGQEVEPERAERFIAAVRAQQS